MYRASKHHGFIGLAIAAAMTIPLAACEDDEDIDDEQVAEERRAGEEAGRELADQLEQEIGDIDTVPEAEVAGRIASVTTTINEGEILQAELALDRAEDDDVYDLAQRIYDDHELAQQQQELVLEDLQYTSIDTTVARTLEEDAITGADELEQARGADFDREYALMQVRMHAAGLELLDAAEEWAPDNDFRDYVSDLRDVIEDHLDYAIDVAEDVRSD